VSQRCGEECVPLPGTEPRYPGRPACSLVTQLTILARGEEKINGYKILARRSERMDRFGDWRRWESNIKMDHREVAYM
jgi:hypothetical protein